MCEPLCHAFSASVERGRDPQPGRAWLYCRSSPSRGCPPPPPDPLDTAPQPTSRVNIQASRTLSFSDRPLSCPTWFRAGCEGQGDGGKVAGGLGLVGLAVVASDKGGQGARDRRPDIKSATLCPPFSTTLNHFSSPRSDLTYTHQQLNSVQLSELWPWLYFSP